MKTAMKIIWALSEFLAMLCGAIAILRGRADVATCWWVLAIYANLNKNEQNDD